MPLPDPTSALERAIRASLKPAPLALFWGLSIGLLGMALPSFWVHLAFILAYGGALIWFSLCLWVRKDLDRVAQQRAAGIVEAPAALAPRPATSPPATAQAPLEVDAAALHRMVVQYLQADEARAEEARKAANGAFR